MSGHRPAVPSGNVGLMGGQPSPSLAATLDEDQLSRDDELFLWKLVGLFRQLGYKAEMTPVKLEPLGFHLAEEDREFVRSYLREHGLSHGHEPGE